MKRPMKFNDMTREQKDNVIEDLNLTNNMADFLNVLNEHFKLNECKPGSITKGMLSQQMCRIVLPMINPLVRNE
jgi:hypothetical protein